LKISGNVILQQTRFRDELIFFSYVILITALFQLGTYSLLKWDLERIIIILIIIGQFYLSARLSFPIPSYYFRKATYLLFHIVNFIVFKEILLALTPGYITSDRFFEAQLVCLFLLMLLGRDIALYARLSQQLRRLNQWNQKKILFEKPEKLRIHLGEPGEQLLHPNEIVYIRTKSAGDHTKVFGIKSRETGKLTEYETRHYSNFSEIGNVLRQFPQFKRISQSTVINFKYPFEEEKGVIKLEGRRFSQSKHFSNK
jgi:hypothetical protein